MVSLVQACKTDYDVALVPGGIAEMMLPNEPGKEKVYVTGRTCRDIQQLGGSHRCCLLAVDGLVIARSVRLHSLIRFVKSRRGFIRMALKHGRTIIPCYGCVRARVVATVPDCCLRVCLPPSSSRSSYDCSTG